MADESQYSSGYDSASNKRKYEEQIALPPPPPLSASRRPTGFSSGPIPADPTGAAAPTLPSYNSVPPPADEIQIAKQKAQEIAARLLSGADPKRARVDNGASFDSGEKGFNSGPPDSRPISSSMPSSTPFGYGGYQSGSTKKIEIPNMRVGVIIGKGGDTIKYLQLQSGAKIQVTRDMEADPNSSTRLVELMGTPEQIAKAEQLISDVLQEAEAGGSAVVSRRISGHAGAEQFVMKVPNNKVGLVIGKGGESIKSMQAKSGARIQVIPLHLPPGDTSTERTVQIDGTSDQIELAKQLVNEVISGENRPRFQSMGGYSQQGYQSRPPSSWAPPGAPQMQQPGYGYMQPGGGYPGPTPQYNMPPAPYGGGYPPQHASGGYSSWDQSSAPPSQQTNAGTGYDSYSQQQPSSQQQPPTPGGSSSAPPTDTTGYNYYQQPSGYNNQPGQGYSQDGYGGYGAPQQSGYSYPPYDQQQGYGSSAGYGNPNSASQDGQTPSYSAHGDSSSQAPPVPAQSGQLMSPNPSGYPPQGTTPQPGYGAPTSQPVYGNQPQSQAQSGYGSGQGASPAQKPPAYGQPGYPPAAGPPPSGYGGPMPAQQTGYGPPPTSGQQGYGQAPPSYGSYGSYGQAASGYVSDGSAPGASQSAQQTGASKVSPKG